MEGSYLRNIVHMSLLGNFRRCNILSNYISQIEGSNLNQHSDS